MTRNDIHELKSLAQDRIEDLCQVLLPTGRREGRLWVSSNPVTGDADQEPALKVALNRDTGAWICWRSGDKGDVIGLVAYVLFGETRRTGDACRWLRRWLGLGGMSVEARRELSEEARRRRAERESAAAQKARDTQKAVGRLWSQSTPMTVGRAVTTPQEQHGRAYMAARGCHFEHIPNLDASSFRFHPDLEWWKGAVWNTGPDGIRRKVQPGPKFPAIVSALRTATGQLVAVHCTFLDLHKPAKAPVEKPKLMFGPALGAVVRISHGPEGQPPESAHEAHPLIVGEGLEDGASLAGAIPEARVWMGASLAGMAAAPIEMACVSAAYAAQDNDWTSPQAQAQFAAAMERWHASGKPIAAMSAHGEVKDFNDLLRGDDDGT